MFYDFHYSHLWALDFNDDLINSERAAELFSSCIVNEEGREGLASFFEKRKPYWAREE